MIPKQRLIDFIKPMCICPCCEGLWLCDPDCTFAQDNPGDYQRMMVAREVLIDTPTPRISPSIVDDVEAEKEQAEEA